MSGIDGKLFSFRRGVHVALWVVHYERDPPCLFVHGTVVHGYAGTYANPHWKVVAISPVLL